MKSTYSALINSKFFNPAFNSAIFDGPVRIYFAQFHESLALKIYFCLQQKFPSEINNAKEAYKKNGQNVLVMLYPNTESFEMSFERCDQKILKDELSGDTVIGIGGPFEDAELPNVMNEIMESLVKHSLVTEVPTALA